MTNDFFEGIDDAMDSKQTADQEISDSPKFEPAEGETLHAILLTAKAFTGGRFDPTVVITFRNVGETAIGGVEPGTSGSLFAPTVLRRKLLEAQPAAGKPFALRYEGTPDGKAYKDWTLITSYMKTGNQTDLDPGLWSGIARTIAENTGPRTQNAQPGDTDWKF
ncbi:MAG: hypothetical protein DRH08_00640 [Deltaproteobacteria bacterium]|nr:MAG: hypothetical protein DRH08_00640 [Deltaproteobacteria bacterium]